MIQVHPKTTLDLANWFQRLMNLLITTLVKPNTVAVSEMAIALSIAYFVLIKSCKIIIA
jgi:hypothetical protein